MKKILTFLLTLSWLIPSLARPVNVSAATSGGGPYFSIYSVVQDQTVTVKLRNFPADFDYEVLLGPPETRGVKGVKVATRNSGKGGTYLDTYTIPISLQGHYQIGIRIQRAADSGYIDDAVFYNHTQGSQPVSTPCNEYEGYPTFSIHSVVRNQEVTIRAYNMPPENTFEVLMGVMGTRGVNGIKVATIESQCGAFPEYTLTIPSALRGLERITIRMQSLTKPDYVAFNWFHNSTDSAREHQTHDATTPEPPQDTCPAYDGFPTFTILRVVRDKEVTLRAFNLPGNDRFKVLMGPMGTRGIGGVRVGTFDTDCDSKQDLTFPVPAGLHRSYRIAMRFESLTGSGYFAFNWFFNNTTP